MYLIRQQTIVLIIFLLAIFALTSANLLEEKILLSMSNLPTFPPSPGLTVLLSQAIRWATHLSKGSSWAIRCSF